MAGGLVSEPNPGLLLSVIDRLVWFDGGFVNLAGEVDTYRDGEDDHRAVGQLNAGVARWYPSGGLSEGPHIRTSTECHHDTFTGTGRARTV